MKYSRKKENTKKVKQKREMNIERDREKERNK